MLPLSTVFRPVNLYNSDTQLITGPGGVPFEDDLAALRSLLQKSAYGNSLDGYLEAAWAPLLLERRIMLAMIEQREQGIDSHGNLAHKTRPVGFRFVCFITDDFRRRTMRMIEEDVLEPSLILHLMRQHTKHSSPILTRRQVALANKEEKLNVVSFTAHDPRIMKPTRLHPYINATIGAFSKMCIGYSCQGCLFDGYTTLGRLGTFASGFKIIFRFPTYYRNNNHVDEEMRNWIAYVERGHLGEHIGKVIHTSASYIHPILNFTRLQRETLELYFEGADDETVAGHYGVGVAAIRTRFYEMYNQLEAMRAEGALPRELAYKPRVEIEDLLNYVRNHPEECRPHA